MTIIGTHIDHLQITERLGTGGMGDVYVAYDNKLDRKVALKAIRTEKRLDAQAKTRLRREAKLLSKLEHAYICRLYDLIEHPEGDFLVMELIKGQSLRDAMNQGLESRQKLTIARDLAIALAVAHKLNIVHRDLKPENIMLNEAGDVKILDFGLARAMLDLDETVIVTPEVKEDDALLDTTITLSTQVGTISGTPRYMSPEQAHGEAADTASDIYSLGLIFQELFTGKKPYPQGLSLQAQLLEAMQARTRPVSGLAADLTDLIKRMKSRQPLTRPSAEETRQQLNWILAGPQRRRRKILSVGFLTVLLLGTALSTVGFLRARKAQVAAQQVSMFLRDMLVEVDPKYSGIDLKVVDLLQGSAPRIDQEFADHTSIRADLHQTFAEIFAALGEYQLALDHATEAAGLHSRQLGENHPTTLFSKTAVANNTYELGQYQDALPLQQDLLDLSRRVHGPNHPETLNHMSNLALTLSHLGQPQEAMRLQRLVLQRETQQLGSDHPSTLISGSNLAQALLSQGHLDGAEKLQREVVQKSSRILGNDHPDTLTSMVNLAAILSDLERHDEAESLLGQVVESEKRILGPDHPGLWITMGNHANALSKLDRKREAEPIQREVAARSSREFGENHPNSLIAWGNLAVTLADLERFQEAETLQQDLVTRFTAVMGADHPSTIITTSNWAKTIWQMGQLERAIALQTRVVDRCNQVLGPNHPSTLKSVARLAEMKAQRQP